MVSHHQAKFGDHNDFVSGDIMVLLCHVILKKHAIKWSRNLMVRSSSG